MSEDLDALAEKEAIDRFLNADPAKLPQEVYNTLSIRAGFGSLNPEQVANLFNDTANMIDIGGGFRIPTVGGAELQFKDEGDKFVNANIYWNSLQ